jgi:hypothetical protein
MMGAKVIFRCRLRTLPVALLTAALLAMAGCTSGPAHLTAAHGPSSDFVVSYAGAANWLTGMTPADANEQLRDWLRTALAAHLNTGTAQFRDESFDTLPVRDQSFADLSNQVTGPGRALMDGHGVLHLLVPLGGARESRTIGLLLDQYRTDHGSDPAQVQIQHYVIDPGSDTIDVTGDPPASTASVRAAHGYVSMRVDTLKGLTAFLSKTQSLSRLWLRGSQTWADGWNWPDVQSVPLNATDVSVIQAGYAHASSGTTPGFSLDPAPLSSATGADVHAVIPGLSLDLLTRIFTNNWPSAQFKSADDLRNSIEGTLFNNNPPAATRQQYGLPSDRTQLWSLDGLLLGQPIYSQARYDGGLAGTSVGMTLFYTDYVTKHWVAGVGDGVPTAAVGGFVPDNAAVTPWSECPSPGDPLTESGRLWFGQNDSAFSYTRSQVDIGTQATRLFARSNGPHGTEVEESYSFGRGLRWWDQHQQVIADYEPQYQRLDQIMRWSGALEWLTRQSRSLRTAQAAASARALTFKAWYAQHNELRERSPADLVTPPSATQEAVVNKPTKTFTDCGYPQIEGGVSLSNVFERTGGKDYHPDLPAPVSRAGLFDDSSHVNARTGDGTISEVSIDDSGKVAERVVRTVATDGDHATVKVVATPRKVIPFGQLKVWRSDTAKRELSDTITAGGHQVSQDVDYQGENLGTLVAADTAGVVTIQWARGPVDRARRLLESIQNYLSTASPLAADGLLYEMKDSGGATQYRTGGPNAPWLTISGDPRPPGKDLAFRLGAPNPDLKSQDSTTFYEATFGAGQPPPGGGSSFLSVTPATPGEAAVAFLAGPPKKSDPTVRVTSRRGGSATLSVEGDHVVVAADDPILGIGGTVEGAALLRDFPHVLAVMSQVHDHYLHAVALGSDGVALVGSDKITLAAMDDPWAERVMRAIGADPENTVPLMEIDKGRLLQVDDSPLTLVAGSVRQMSLGEVLANPGAGGVYLHESLKAILHLQDGPIVPEILPADYAVTVVFAVENRWRRGEKTQAGQPDVLIQNNARWLHVQNLAGLNASQNSTASPGASLPAAGGVLAGAPAGSTASGPVLLICPASGPGASACDASSARTAPSS